MIYGKALAILLLLSAIAGVIWWHNSKLENAYDAGKQAGVDAERVVWKEKQIGTQNEILRLQAEIFSQKQAAEQAINAERKTWWNRVNKLKNMVTDCAPPAVLIELRDSGVYTGPIPCK
jgi:hypothetical protein